MRNTPYYPEVLIAHSNYYVALGTSVADYDREVIRIETMLRKKQGRYWYDILLKDETIVEKNRDNRVVFDNFHTNAYNALVLTNCKGWKKSDNQESEIDRITKKMNYAVGKWTDSCSNAEEDT